MEIDQIVHRFVEAHRAKFLDFARRAAEAGPNQQMARLDVIPGIRRERLERADCRHPQGINLGGCRVDLSVLFGDQFYRGRLGLGFFFGELLQLFFAGGVCFGGGHLVAQCVFHHDQLAGSAIGSPRIVQQPLLHRPHGCQGLLQSLAVGRDLRSYFFLRGQHFRQC